jgi:RNA polymerase sigma-70 factor (ECF subfamily)
MDGNEERGGASAHAGFRATFEEHFDHVRRALRRLGVRGADVEDLSQEVFVTFHRRRHDYDVERPVRPWLRGIALRVAATHRRRARQVPEAPDDEDQEDHAPDAAPLPDQRIAEEQDRALVIEALAAVDAGRRAVIVMHELDGAPMPDVARTLGIPLNTAYSRLRVGRVELRTAARRLLQKRA